MGRGSFHSDPIFIWIEGLDEQWVKDTSETIEFTLGNVTKDNILMILKYLFISVFLIFFGMSIYYFIINFPIIINDDRNLTTVLTEKFENVSDLIIAIENAKIADQNAAKYKALSFFGFVYLPLFFALGVKLISIKSIINFFYPLYHFNWGCQKKSLEFKRTLYGVVTAIITMLTVLLLFSDIRENFF